MNRNDKVHLIKQNKKHLATIKIKPMASTEAANREIVPASPTPSHSYVSLGSSLRSGTFSGTDASQIHTDLQNKFNGFAITACDDLQQILEQAGEKVTEVTELVTEGTSVIGEVRHSVNQNPT
jgi:hypothetical protein